jgi:hypothetical protein
VHDRRRNGRRTAPPLRKSGGRVSAFALLLTLLAAGVARGDDSEWYAGRLTSAWTTSSGIRGHTQDCRTSACDDADFDRGNLDSSIGIRIGATRELTSRCRFRLLAAGELDILATEYNFSQHDVEMFVPSLGLSGSAGIGTVRMQAEAGGGALLTSDGRSREGYYRGFAVSMPEVLPLRIGRRWWSFGEVELRETFLLLVPETGGAMPGRWSVLAGVSLPGAIAGDDLSLKEAPMTRVAWELSSFSFTLSTTGHESELRSDYRGTPGNQRTRHVPALGASYLRAFGPLALGIGAEVADWEDSQPLLVDVDGSTVKGGIEASIVASGRVQFAPGSGVIEYVRWLDLDLTELRVLAGLSW